MVKASELIAVAVIGVIGLVAYFLYRGSEDIAGALQGFQLPSVNLPGLPNITLPNITLPNITLPNITLPNISLRSVPDLFASPSIDIHQGQQDLITKTFPQIVQSYQPAIQHAFEQNPSSLGVTPSTNKFRPAIG